MKILVAGLPGSGKTTQARKLSEDLGLCFVKTGEILRQIAQEDSELGKKVKADLEKGELADNQLVADVVKKQLELPECQNGFVVDGYPRSFEQLAVFDPGYEKVIYLKVSDEVVRKRLAQRGRADDSPEAIEERLRVQKADLEPILNYFRMKSEIIEVDGEQSIDQVYHQIKEKLDL